MKKTCVICQIRDADYCVKGTNECYCYTCGKEHFGDLGLLVKIEKDAKLLNEYIERKIALDDDEIKTDSKTKDEDDILIDVKIKRKRVSKKKDD